MNGILIAIVVLFGTGLALGLLLAYFSKVFHVEEDPRIDQIEEVLPGANCGACGMAGCRDYAKACVGEGEPPACPVGGAAVSSAVAKILGTVAQDVEAMVALVKCAGTEKRATARGPLEGVNRCAEAFLLGGNKDCRHGCMGYGDCVRVCPADAITIYQGNVAIVDADKCIGCGLCVQACPSHVISMVPKSRTVHVLCNSKDIAALTRTSCTVGCIGCRICARSDAAFVIEDNLASFTGTTAESTVPYVCPNDVIVDTRAFSVRAFVESDRAREDFTAAKTEFKEKERLEKLAAAEAKKAAAAKAAQEKAAAEGSAKEGKDE
ncbi:RnfABCDGE type electron transport complex subunit B [Myxococcota bacterium]|nr:RnfABCDGE type electron transport complex subunit B [Myxococcota bacterium]MBU1537258.1 RnfABCDGE type electron transport complex subunit B [Myxococcota bacterium]